jgi:thioredoxin 1
MAVVNVTDATFAEVVLKSAKPVVVDYWADWCAPCRQLSPIIEELATELGDKVTFVKMDTNTNTQTPIQQGVMSLPTIQVFLGGEVVKQFVGAKPKSAFVKALQEFI